TCDDAGTPFVQLDARNLQTSAVYTTKTACGLLYARTEGLPLGPYEGTMSLLDGRGRPVSQIVGGPFDVRRHDLTALRPVQFQVQVFEVGWILVRQTGATSRPLTCTEAGARTVELITQLASEPSEKFTFDCNDGEGITQAIRVGNYAYQARLLNA